MVEREVQGDRTAQMSEGAQSQRLRNITACLVQLLLVGAGAMVLSALSRVAERSDWVQNA